MRWDKTLEGALIYGAITVAAGAGVYFTDGKITAAEIVAAVGLFLGGVASYIKQHQPVD